MDAKTVGVSLLAMAVCQAKGIVDRFDAIASRLTPTGDFWLVRDLWRDK
jgi:hypothetical protein